MFCIFISGHVKLYRIIHAEREEKKKTDKKDKKDKDAEEEERNKLTIHFVKYTLGLKHQVSQICIIFYILLNIYVYKILFDRFTNKKEKNIEFMDNGVGNGYQKHETIN